MMWDYSDQIALIVSIGTGTMLSVLVLVSCYKPAVRGGAAALTVDAANAHNTTVDQTTVDGEEAVPRNPLRGWTDPTEVHLDAVRNNFSPEYDRSMPVPADRPAGFVPRLPAHLRPYVDKEDPFMVSSESGAAARKPPPSGQLSVVRKLLDAEQKSCGEKKCAAVGEKLGREDLLREEIWCSLNGVRTDAERQALLNGRGLRFDGRVWACDDDERTIADLKAFPWGPKRRVRYPPGYVRPERGSAKSAEPLADLDDVPRPSKAESIEEGFSQWTLSNHSI